ncbi:hypothetical protein BJF89_00415 [Corynebacterium sp. CNJ-954]|uniref:hypothetical protein n=1 Tax=Corynebacterium sp. CNJ-954 TaxID=1904962 RepID=UPI0009690F7F|nr:hypothetical protein [Corynebacterium sp. CNJ-954]OLT54755.1 hypothetical protein BJF89_00415 [Corynebacterium sp. CNJ-954]
MSPCPGSSTRPSNAVDGLERTWSVCTTDSGWHMVQRLAYEAPDLVTGIVSGNAETTAWDGDSPVQLIAGHHSGHCSPTATGRRGNTGGARYDSPGVIWELFSGR